MSQLPPTFPFAGSTIIATRPNTVALKFSGYHKEARSGDSGNIYPGMLLQLQSDATVIRHNLAGGGGAKYVAKEDALQGHWLLDPMVSGDVVQYCVSHPGDVFLVPVNAGAPAIAANDDVISAGDGTVEGAFGQGGNVLYESTAASAVITNTTVETAFNKSFSIPANTLKAGDVIHIRTEVAIPAAHSTDTLTLKVKIGSTILLATAAVDVAASDVGVLDITLVVRTGGASGTIVANGTWNLGTPGTATNFSGALGSTAIDTTAAQSVTVTATWSVADAGNQVRLDSLNSEIDRQVTPWGKALEALDNSVGTTMQYLRVEMY